MVRAGVSSRMRILTFLILPHLLLAVSIQAAQTGERTTPSASWERLVIGRGTYYVMPDDVARSLGCEREGVPDDRNAASLYLRGIREWHPTADVPPDDFDKA